MTDMKTVTFNADTITAAQHRSAMLGSRVISITAGIPAIGFAGLAMFGNAQFAYSFGADTAEAFKYGAWGVLATLPLVGLPVAAGMISRNYADVSTTTMRVWKAALLISAAGATYAAIAWPDPHAPAKAAALREKVRYLQGDAWETWENSHGCTVTSGRYVVPCAELKAWRQAEWTRAAEIEAGAPFRDRIGALLMNLGAVMFAAFLGRPAVLGIAESWRLGEGTASAAPAGAAIVVPAGPALEAKIDTLEGWFQINVIPDEEGFLSPTDALAHYETVCRANGQQPDGSGAFFSFLANKAGASDGAVKRRKIGGKHVWAGWTLAAGIDAAAIAAPVSITELPYRTAAE
jgi:hypothetical protein